LNNVGYVALLRGELKRAEAYFLRAIESSPSFYQPAAENLRLLGGMKQIAAGALKENASAFVLVCAPTASAQLPVPRNESADSTKL
jgi:Flp pilus assembly protein TadD